MSGANTGNGHDGRIAAFGVPRLRVMPAVRWMQSAWPDALQYEAYP